jgi:transposase-like protein
MINMVFELTTDDTWQAAAAIAAPGVLGITYTCPRCQGFNEIRIQAPRPGTLIETQLWCHHCQHGADATITAREGTPRD